MTAVRTVAAIKYGFRSLGTVLLLLASGSLAYGGFRLFVPRIGVNYVKLFNGNVAGALSVGNATLAAASGAVLVIAGLLFAASLVGFLYKLVADAAAVAVEASADTAATADAAADDADPTFEAADVDADEPGTDVDADEGDAGPAGTAADRAEAETDDPLDGAAEAEVDGDEAVPFAGADGNDGSDEGPTTADAFEPGGESADEADRPRGRTVADLGEPAEPDDADPHVAVDDVAVADDDGEVGADEFVPADDAPDATAPVSDDEGATGRDLDSATDDAGREYDERGYPRAGAASDEAVETDPSPGEADDGVPVRDVTPTDDDPPATDDAGGFESPVDDGAATDDASPAEPTESGDEVPLDDSIEEADDDADGMGDWEPLDESDLEE